MAKGQKRSNREVRKPKMDKSKTPPVAGQPATVKQIFSKLTQKRDK